MPDDFFAPPAFKPDDALLRLKRELRAAGLAEREGAFERRGLRVARARIEGGALLAGVVKRPGLSPEWQPDKMIKDSAGVRDFVALVKKHLNGWSDSES